MGQDLSEDRKLCPVRALKVYRGHTAHLRRGKKLLFVAYKTGHAGDIHKNTISGWIRQLLHFVYSAATGDMLPLANRVTHEVRAMASSLAFRGNVPLEEIMQACSWQSPSTFTSFYLRDLHVVQEGLSRLGPLVVA